MLNRQDGYGLAVDMLIEIENTNGYGSNYNLVKHPPDNAGRDWEYEINEGQDNILFRHIQALSSDPANIEALRGFCAVLTDKVSYGADAEAYEEFTN